ncbi:MAG: glycosyltransferase family 39 protein [Deltaproteobacteria bacterium]|nr:glycosyltransferase family 39 protein [Deltaproteobacteria bacterium]
MNPTIPSRFAYTRLAAWLFLGAVLLAACFYNLHNYPTLWWDEAIFSETAANLSQSGRYAMTVQSPDQFSDLDFRISVGPAVILPVALAYRLLGVGLLPGRLIAAAYLLLAFAALYLAARRLWGSTTGALAVLLALLGTDVLYWGRSVMGDVPALSFFLLGLWFLLQSLDSGPDRHLFLGGLCLGLAFTAKEFYGAAFLPPLLVLAGRTWRNPKRLIRQGALFCLGISLPLAAYLLLKVAILGSLSAAVGHFLDQKVLLRYEFFTPLTLGRIYPESFAYLLGHPLFWLGLSGCVWCWRRAGPSPGLTLWLANFLLWSLIYLTAVYWHRFALPALFLACAPGAYLLVRLYRRLSAQLISRLAQGLAGFTLGGFLFLSYPFAGLDILGTILTCKTSPAENIKAYLKTHVPPQCLIETPEYELAFLDDNHRFHLMPAFYFVESDENRTVLLNPRPRRYDFEENSADYLVLGSFGKSVFQEVYPPGQVAKNWRKLAQVDFYDIYIRKTLTDAASLKNVLPF